MGGGNYWREWGVGNLASAGQRKCRNLFKEAVAYAKAVIADQEQKTAWQKRLGKTRGIYNAAISHYMKKEKLNQANNQLLTERLIRQAVKGQPVISRSMLVNTTTTGTSPIHIVIPAGNNLQHCIRAGTFSYNQLLGNL